MSKAFDVVELSRGEHDLAAMHECVLDGCGRIEIIGPTGSSVLISQRELTSLEQALQVYAATSAGQSMRAETARLARSAAPHDLARQTIAAILTAADDSQAPDAAV